MASQKPFETAENRKPRRICTICKAPIEHEFTGKLCSSCEEALDENIEEEVVEGLYNRKRHGSKKNWR